MRVPSLQSGCLKKTASGFTLIELLIAMVIFAIMATLAYGGLRAVINSSSGVQRQIKQLESLQRCMMFLDRDMRQIVARPINTDVARRRSAVELSPSGPILFEFTRTGQPNPAGSVQSGLQRVAYQLSEGVLTRQTWSVVDHVQNEEPIEMKLLDNLNGVEFRLLNKDFEWQTSWGQKKEQLEMIPFAVDVTIDHKKWGIVRRLIPVYGY